MSPAQAPHPESPRDQFPCTGPGNREVRADACLLPAMASKVGTTRERQSGAGPTGNKGGKPEQLKGDPEHSGTTLKMFKKTRSCSRLPWLFPYLYSAVRIADPSLRFLQ